jgi:hypothetical protein
MRPALACCPSLAHTPPATVCRVTLSALTAPAIREAFADPRPLNRSAIEAEAARRQIEPLTAEVVAAAARQHGHALPAVSRTALVALCRLAAPAEPTADGWTLALRVRLGEVGLRAAVHTADGARIRLSTPAPCTVPAPLLEETVRYAVVIRAVDPATSALAVEKSWSLPGGEPGVDRLTLVERLRDEPNPYWNTDGEVSPPVPGSWDELVERQTPHAPQGEPHPWTLHTRPAETPEGAPLGIALFVTETPPPTPDADTARTLEMAHFASEADARRFAAEFRAVLVPGVLDGPELAPEVAKLEGLSGDWQALDTRALADAAHSRAIVRDAADWHLHDPNAERDVDLLF